MKHLFSTPRARRQTITVVSGVLILLALAAGLAGLPAVRYGLMVAAALIAGSDIALRAWRSLRQRHVSIELLVTIAAAGALLIGEVWEAAAVTFLFMLGAYLEARTMARTRRALQELLAVAPSTAIVLRDGQQVEVAAHRVQTGETVLVKPGARIAVDGEVGHGRATVDESAITGESMPVEKSAGDAVYAGTINQNGLLHVQATGVGADTTLARIIRRVEEAQEAKAPTQQFIERFARWYTPAIIGLSAAAYLLSGDVRLALTLLVIGCPGALVISTPVSVVAGIGRAAQRGILIQGGQFLEQAGNISAIALDKTGTLTANKPRLTDVIALQPQMVPAGAPTAVATAAGDAPAGNGQAAADAWNPQQRELIRRAAVAESWTPRQRKLIRWATIAESGSEHPLAAPILAAASALDVEQQDVDFDNVDIDNVDIDNVDFDAYTGRGVRAIYDGHSIVVGSPALLAELNIPVPPHAAAHLQQHSDAGKNAVLEAVDGLTQGILGIADTLRPDAAGVVRRLQQSGLHVAMLTGDNERTARAIAREAGIDDVRAGLMPEDKLNAIHDLQRRGHVVAMVGDGINDAPALAAADVGMAMGAAGTDVAIETADIALMADDLRKIPEAVRLSHATLRNIRQNVAIALLTVGGLLTGVLLGEVHMAGGMFVHELSVLVVIVNGMRLLRA